MSAWDPIATIASQVQAKKVTARSLVERALKTFDAKKDYQAIIAKTTKRALQRADDIDARIAGGENVGRLAGVPFIAKDNFLAFGADTTAASNMLKGFDAPYQATAIERLETAGAICIAKANLDAFAHGSSTENSDFFTTLNPQDKTRVPGGSSGGSAAAVMLDMAPFALGTDTGGSIRLPASFCGAVGFKPTYGAVSRSGVVAMASSTDVIGPIAKTVDDAALVFDVMSGRDPLDSTTIERSQSSYVPDHSVVNNLAGKTIGIVQDHMGDGVDDAVISAINNSVDQLKSNGVKVRKVHLPSLPLALAVYYIVVPAEISSNLSRYDGQRFGYSDQTTSNLDDSYTRSRSKGFGREAKRRIMIGTYVLSSGYYDAYYKRAQQVRTKLITEYNKAFADVDFLIGPAAPTPAFKLGANTDDPLKMYLADVMTVGASLVGIPAIVVPAGKSGALPIGLQIMAPQKHDKQLLEFAKATQGVIA